MVMDEMKLADLTVSKTRNAADVSAPPTKHIDVSTVTTAIENIEQGKLDLTIKEQVLTATILPSINSSIHPFSTPYMTCKPF
jgi:hypothetical protein